MYTEWTSSGVNWSVKVHIFSNSSQRKRETWNKKEKDVIFYITKELINFM